MRGTLLPTLTVAAALVGCATQTIYVRELPPAHLLEDCPASVVEVRTNGDLARAILAARKDLDYCNDDKAALRFWAKEKE